MLTTFDTDEYVYEALRGGASGFLLKDIRSGQLTEAVRTVAAGQSLLSPTITASGSSDSSWPARPRRLGLSNPGNWTSGPRERQVLLLIAQGLSNAEIAGRLRASGNNPHVTSCVTSADSAWVDGLFVDAHVYLSEATVKTHVNRLLAKLGLRDRVQAMVLAYEISLITPGTRSGKPA